MFDSWKFSKGSYLTILLTALASFLVLGFAYHTRRYSEILTGVIGGLTIILGMLTAEWLRASREQVELTRARFYEMRRYFARYLYNFEDFMRDQYSQEKSQHMEDHVHIFNPLNLMARTTRWPQPNAKRIRVVALELITKLLALHKDADESGYIWTLEERMALSREVSRLIPLIWAQTPEELDELNSQVDKHRKVLNNDGIPITGTKNPLNY